MVDRQDIDALLIGSLYGELSSTEEARLTAHLDSHPADRTALANLSHAREVVRESRILQVQFEPSQSISALLMQEAVRRAPKPRNENSWFQRFTRSFMTHPAMAAAAMLVLIVGVAGTVYLRTGDQFAKQTKDDSVELSSNDSPTLPAPPAVATPPAEQDKTIEGKIEGKSGIANLDETANGQIHQGSGSAASQADDFKVQLQEEAQKKQPADTVVGGNAPADRARNLEDGRAAATKNKKGTDLAFDANQRRDDEKKKVAKEVAKEDGDADAIADRQVPKAAKAPAKTTSKPAPRLDVTTPTQAPKDFESSTTNAAGPRGETTRKGDATGAPGGGAGTSSPRAPTVADPKPNTQPAPPPPPPPAATAESKKLEKTNAADLAWAKEQHGKVIAAVNARKCDVAANLAVDIANRAPAYYASNVETDRAIKTCQQYIAQQREKEAERVQRAKSTQRHSADEAPAPAPKPSSTTK